MVHHVNCHQDKTLASASQGVGVAQISDEVAGAKLGLLQFESWSSDEVALIGRALSWGYCSLKAGLAIG